ncbi:hypothetical protein GCM10010166_25190 [Couchioplanes caeruleus subsp. azureus]|nr:hypothetical protein [Couchioplanes caeruleus]GGQ55061.1 hypothetical protein GCM10010166_25190 [Couchioplanes caeruleus subsp. azureus]
MVEIGDLPALERRGDDERTAQAGMAADALRPDVDMDVGPLAELDQTLELDAHGLRTTDGPFEDGVVGHRHQQRRWRPFQDHLPLDPARDDLFHQIRR